MAAPGIRRFAIDVNFVLDLAAGADFAHRLKDVLIEQGYSFDLPHTAVVELALIARNFGHPANGLATKGMQSLSRWNVTPRDLAAVEHGIADEFARDLIKRGLLPLQERNDGLILAEASLIGATHLLSSDRHLTNIDAAELRFIFESRHLRPVDVVRPREMARLLRRMRGG